MIAAHFDLDEWTEDRRKRYRIRDSLRRVYTRPNAAEVAALQAEAEARRKQQASSAALLESLLAKIKGSLDDREKRRIDPDLEALAALQRARVVAGPAVNTDPQALAVIQGAIMAGSCLEFDYLPEGATAPKWRRVAPFGLLHGPITYLIGKFPDRALPPVPYRLDRMSAVRLTNLAGAPPADWDLDAWTAQSFGIWREEDHDIVLRVAQPSIARARQWRFHPAQQIEDRGDTLIVRFRAGGLREIAEHLFTWGGEVAIEAPEILRQVMRERLAAADRSLRPEMSDLAQS